jgi:hypothetical protein
MAIARTCAGVLEDEQQLVLDETMVRGSTLQPMLDSSWSHAAPVPAIQADAARTRGLGLPPLVTCRSTQRRPDALAFLEPTVKLDDNPIRVVHISGSYT